MRVTLFVIGLVVTAVIVLGGMAFLPDIVLFFEENADPSGMRIRAFAYLAFPVMALCAFILSRKANRKNKQCRRLQEKLEKVDQSWNEWTLQKRMKEVFFKVQHAWNAQDQEVASGYVSQNLINGHLKTISDLAKKGYTNKRGDVRLYEALIVHIEDYIDNSKDTVWAVMEGSKRDYLSNSNVTTVYNRQSIRPEPFKDLWKFVRDDNGEWVVDEIALDVGHSDLDKVKAYSERV